MTSAILPYAKITNQHRDANSAINICSGTLRLTVSPVKQSKKKWWERIGSFIEEVKTFGLSVPRYRAAEIEVDFTEESKIFGIRSQRALLKRHVTLRHN